MLRSWLAAVIVGTTCTGTGCSETFVLGGMAIPDDLEVELHPPPVEATGASASHGFYPLEDPVWTQPPEHDGPRDLAGGGVIVADLTGNGSLEVVLVGPDAQGCRVYFSDDVGTTWRADPGACPAIDYTGAVGGSAADVDGDRDLDLVLIFDGTPNRLLMNDGDGHFTDTTSGSGLDLSIGRSVSASWGDVDGDGNLDLFVGRHASATWTQPSRLYLGDGDGHFRDATGTLPSNVHEGNVFTSALVDVEGDGLPELLTVHDVGGTPSGLYWNDRGTLTHDPACGVGLSIPGMGLAFGDLNADGIPDLLESSHRALVLLESTGPVWVETSRARGLVPNLEAGQELGWGAELGDLDNDGDLDAVVTYGDWDAMDTPARQPDAVYLQQSGRFTDVAPQWSLDDGGPGRGVVLVDLNRDGWLDILRRPLGLSATVHLASPGEGHFLVVSLEQVGSRNTRALGARIEVIAEGTRHVRWMTSGSSGLFSGGPAEVHFGLGLADRVDRMEIMWPDGTLSVVEDFESDQFVNLRRPAG